MTMAEKEVTGGRATSTPEGGEGRPLSSRQEDAPAASGTLPVDPASLEEIASLKEDRTSAFLKEVISVYLESSGRQLAEIRRAAAAADAQALMRAAHGLKSPSGYLGAKGLMELCREVEGLARAGDLAGAEGLLASLEAEYERVRLFLKERLSSLG